MKANANAGLPIENIKLDISSNIGKTINITVFNKQRKAINKFSGVILEVYDKLFLVYITVNNYHLNKSFSYVSFSVGDMQYELIG